MWPLALNRGRDIDSRSFKDVYDIGANCRKILRAKERDDRVFDLAFDIEQRF